MKKKQTIDFSKKITKNILVSLEIESKNLKKINLSKSSEAKLILKVIKNRRYDENSTKSSLTSIYL